MVDGPELVVVADGASRRSPLTTLGEAAAFVGADLFPDGAPADGEPLAIDPEAATRLGTLYGVAAEALAAFRDELPADADPSTINLWPEHFDIAIEAGAEGAGKRANYGVSPGDEEHAQPYAYVGPWSGEATGELWNATGFAGAELGYESLAAEDDPVAAIIEFFRSRFEALTSSS